MNRFWKKQLPALVLALVMLASLAPAALAADCPPGFPHSGNRGPPPQTPNA